jgi:hypothetical protein
VISNQIICHTVQFEVKNTGTESISEIVSIEVFTPTLHFLSHNPNGTDVKASYKLMNSVLDTLSESTRLHGTEIYPPQLFATFTASSVSSEIETLKALREKYVERLMQLNEVWTKCGPTTVDEKENSANLSPVSINTMARLEEHKKNKERLRLELKELLQALAGLMAEHKNVSLPDIISEYKGML